MKYLQATIQGILALTVCFSGTPSLAADNAEIEFLLTSLAESGCTFIRNGDEHEAQKARDHLEMKYNHAKYRIKTAEDFIEKIASKSSLSRKPYRVHCGEEEIASKQWLENMLAVHRGRKDSIP